MNSSPDLSRNLTHFEDLLGTSKGGILEFTLATIQFSHSQLLPLKTLVRSGFNSVQKDLLRSLLLGDTFTTPLCTEITKTYEVARSKQEPHSFLQRVILMYHQNMDMGLNGRWTQIDAEAHLEQPKDDSEQFERKSNEFRTVLPQILASSAKNLLLLDLGMTLAYPTIAIPELLDSEEDLKFTGEEASWFGSIPFICQPLGSVISGFLFEPLGRKKAMLLVNLPHVLGWFLIYFAKSTTHLYLAAIILGAGIGFMEAPIITYVGEICQPKWRGMLAAYAGICVAIGFLFINFLGTATNWRTAAAICSSVPMFAFLAILQVPESPVWLMSKGRLKEAERSLCWLRGWVKPEVVEKEFSYLVEHNTMNKEKEIINIKTISSEIERQNSPENCDNIPPKGKFFITSIVNTLNLNYIFHRSTLQPLLLVSLFFIVHHASGITSTRPFMVEIFKELGTVLDGNWVTVISSAVGITGNITGMIWLRFSGKRKLALISALICILCNLSISIYGFVFFNSSLSWIPITLFILLNFGWSFGIGQIPWMLTSEIFPFRGRGIASGIAAASSYVLGFIFTKTYYDMHESLTLPGTFGFFAIFTIIGSVFLYYFLPETEGKTLKEVEVILSETFDGIFKRSNRRSEFE